MTRELSLNSAARIHAQRCRMTVGAARHDLRQAHAHGQIDTNQVRPGAVIRVCLASLERYETEAYGWQQ